MRLLPSIYITALLWTALIGAATCSLPPGPLPPAQALPPAAAAPVHKNLNPYKVIRTTPSMLENTLNRLVNSGYAITGILSTINQDKFTIIAFRPNPQ